MMHEVCPDCGEELKHISKYDYHNKLFIDTEECICGYYNAEIMRR